MDRRFAGMLVAATALHVAVYAVTAATRRPTGAVDAGLDGTPLELTEIVSIENTKESPPETEPPLPTEVPAGGVAAPGIVTPRVSSVKAKPTSASSASGELTAPSGTDVAGPELSAQSGTEPPAPKPKIPPLIDLGSPGKHAIILPQTPTGDDAPVSKEKQLAAKLDAQLKAGLDAKDTELGTGYGGPVATAAHGAAQGSMAPQTGWATYDVQTDAAGTITLVRLVDFNADKAGWEHVASGMRTTLSTQKLRVPGGANGVQVRVRVEASMKLPSGAKKGVQVQGLGFGFDVADIGQQPKRVVSAHVVSEQRI